MAKGRKSISTSLRYDIFTRDGYTCQYCGNKPPDVVLELDHRVPVAAGGDNDPMNLLTACWACNSGKKAKLPGQFSPVPDADVQMLKVSQEAAEYERYLAASERRTVMENRLIEYFQRLWTTISQGSLMPSERVIKSWLFSYGPEITEEGINSANAAFGRRQISSNTQFTCNEAIKYTSGIMKRIVAQREGVA